jgi:hypothetical protein
MSPAARLLNETAREKADEKSVGDGDQMSAVSTLHHQGAALVVEWMMREGRHSSHMREFGDEMCRRIVAAEIPLWRAFCSVDTLHPQIAATAYIWRRGRCRRDPNDCDAQIRARPGVREKPDRGRQADRHDDS